MHKEKVEVEEADIIFSSVLMGEYLFMFDTSLSKSMLSEKWR
jgi:hypothetical protein